MLKATSDPVPDVREAAIRALEELNLLQALPRLQQLQVVQSNFYVQEAAYLAGQKLDSKVAADLGLGPSQGQALSVAPATGWAYAVTSKGIYAKQNSDWYPVENLPDLPTGVIATDSQGGLVYAGTQAGLFKSMDGGKSWQPIPIQLPLCRLSPELAQIHPFGTYSVDIPEGITTFFILEFEKGNSRTRLSAILWGAVTVSAVDGNIYVDPVAMEHPYRREMDWEGLTEPIGTKNVIVYTSSIHNSSDEQTAPSAWLVQ